MMDDSKAWVTVDIVERTSNRGGKHAAYMTDMSYYTAASTSIWYSGWSPEAVSQGNIVNKSVWCR